MSKDEDNKMDDSSNRQGDYDAKIEARFNKVHRATKDQAGKGDRSRSDQLHKREEK